MQYMIWLEQYSTVFLALFTLGASYGIAVVLLHFITASIETEPNEITLRGPMNTEIVFENGVQLNYIETNDELLLTDDEHQLTSIDGRDIPKLIKFLKSVQNEFREGDE